MNDNKLAIESLSMDLKRVALYLHRNSLATVARFEGEAWKRRQEIKLSDANSYLARLIDGVERVLEMPNTLDRKAEDALMYSTLLQNFARKFL